jgi:outer membrane protein assembly factor BamB
MRILRNLLKSGMAVLLVAAAAVPPARGQDTLYIGDGSDNTVKRFNAHSGNPLDAGPFISGLAGPRGLLIDGTDLLVVNQNAGLKSAGEVLAFDAATGAPLGALIAPEDKNAPFVPRGIIHGLSGDLFVANLTTANGSSHGELLRFNAATGELIGSSGPQGFKNKEYHPRGVVFGPDGLLYASVFTSLKTGLGGAVLRFDPEGSFLDVFVEDEGGVGHLNRPEGLVFGPDGMLYITSFRAAPGDTDAIRIYDPTGAYAGQIDLYDPATEPRAFAQALLFGPNGKLFVPLTSSGEVRRYNSPTTGDYDMFIPAGGTLQQPWFLTFGQTDPVTLEYVP